MRNIFSAIMQAIRSALSAGHWVVRHTARGLEKVWESMPALPAISFGGGVGHSEPSEAAVARQAAAQEQAAQKRTEARTEADTLATALRGVARARLEGREPDAQKAALLPPALLRYVLHLSPPELQKLVEPTQEARSLCKALVGGTNPEGFPTPQQLSERVSAARTRAGSEAFRARVAEVRTAKAGAKTETADVIDIASRYRRTAA